MINWSMIGRDAKEKERAAFAKLDKEYEVRVALCKALRVRLDSLGLEDIEFALGGTTSVDIYPQGWDKTYALSHFDNRPVWFVGDKCAPIGNDYTIWKKLQPLDRSYATSGPQETYRILKECILPSLEKKDD